MGLFGGSKTYVSSSLYNLAGDEVLEQMNYLKSTIISSIMIPAPRGVYQGQVIRESYLYGPGMRIRSFFRWAENNYDLIGVPTGTLGGSNQIDQATVIPHIPVTAGSTVDLQQATFGAGDYSYWAEQWMLANYPALINTAWSSDINAAGVITVTFEDTTTASFTPTGFDPSKIYLYTLYVEVTPAELEGDPPIISDQMMWFYEFGAGIVELDALVTEGANDGEYLPFIPIRLDNEFLSDTFNPEAYALAKRAFKKAGGGKLDKIIEKLSDNESLGDIDYAYVMYGVPLNVLDQSSREYLYRFFDRLRLANTESNTEYLLWLNNGGTGIAPTNNVRIKSSTALPTNVDMTVSWKSIALTETAGLIEAGIKVDSYRIVQGIADDTFHLHWQETETNYKTLTVIGAEHENRIYDNKSVIVTSKEALEDADASGFLVPMHFATVKDMRLVDSTQMCVACSYLVLNSYQIVKQKWYQTGIFKIFIFAVAIAVTVATAGTGSASIGVALGLTGTTALIVGAIINVVVGMVISKLISMGAIAAFGDKWGAIIGAIASFVVMSAGSSLLNGQSFSAVFNNMMRAENLLMLANATVNGVSGYIRASAMEVAQETQDLMKEHERESRELTQRYIEEFGYGKIVLDPFALTDSSNANMIETGDSFIGRTLMTGTDIAEMSKDMLNNFADITLTLESG